MHDLPCIRQNLPCRVAYGRAVRFISRYISGLAAALLTAGLLTAGETPDATARIVFNNLCAACHGEKGEGKAEVKAPSIASLPAWYVKLQLANFREDRRGAHPEDMEGQMMRAMAKALPVEQTEAIAGLVEKLPRVKPTPTIEADFARGKEVYADRCMECHRFNGEGELVFGAAPLVGLQDWYLAAQLRKFKAGHRGAAKDDENGQKMVHATRSFIEDEEMVRSIAAWLMELQRKPAARDDAGFIFGKE